MFYQIVLVLSVTLFGVVMSQDFEPEPLERETTRSPAIEVIPDSQTHTTSGDDHSLHSFCSTSKNHIDNQGTFQIENNLKYSSCNYRKLHVMPNLTWKDGYVQYQFPEYCYHCCKYTFLIAMESCTMVSGSYCRDAS